MRRESPKLSGGYCLQVKGETMADNIIPKTGSVSGKQKEAVRKGQPPFSVLMKGSLRYLATHTCVDSPVIYLIAVFNIPVEVEVPSEVA